VAVAVAGSTVSRAAARRFPETPAFFSLKTRGFLRWKGVRVPALEERVIERAAVVANPDRWDLFIPLDAAFEEIASRGDERLARSVGR